MASNRTFEGYVITRTAKAMLFWGHFWHAPMWIPLSQITEIEDDDSHVVHMSNWFSKKTDVAEFTEYTIEQIDARNAR